jgi:hypothetical protein
MGARLDGMEATITEGFYGDSIPAGGFKATFAGLMA